MSQIYSGVGIAYNDFDDNKQYIGSVDLTDTNLSIFLMPNLGTVCFPKSIQTSRSLQTGYGTKVKITGDLQAAGGIFALDDLRVEGNVSGGLGITTGGGIAVSGSIRCDGNITATLNIEAIEGISAFGLIRAGGTIHCLDELNAQLGSLIAGQNIEVWGPVKAKHSIIAKEIWCSATIQAGGDIRAAGLIHADKFIRTDKNIFGGTVSCHESILVSGCIEVEGDLTARCDIQAGRHVKARRLAAARIFAGMNGDVPPLPGDREVHGEIVRGRLAYGRHAAA